MKQDRLTLLTLLSLLLNLAFAGYNCFIGFYSNSRWFITVGLYYIILSVIRFSLLRIKRKAINDNGSESFAKSFTGIMFVFLSISLVGTVVLAAVNDRGIKHHQIVMITIALYAFTKIILGIINLVKSKKSSSPIIKALRNVSLADALVSVFALQRSMLVSFEGLTQGEIRLFNILTGSGVCILILLLGLNLIGGRSIDMAKSKIVKANEKVAGAVVGGYKKVEDAVVSSYKKVEGAVVKGYAKVEDKFVDKYLTREGETVTQAKQRLKDQNKK